MAITSAICNSFKRELLEAQHDFASGTSQTFKMALYTSTASLDADTTTYSSTNEITGTNYTAGGTAITVTTNPAIGTGGGAGAAETIYLGFSDATWSTATFTANGAVIYNDKATDQAIMVIAFGADKSVSNGTFTVTMPTANESTAILRLA